MHPAPGRFAWAFSLPPVFPDRRCTSSLLIVIIAHVNQPTHAAGTGVVKGILDLKAKGYTFVRLDDAAEDGSDDTTN